jgi:hypothetical protein
MGCRDLMISVVTAGALLALSAPSAAVEQLSATLEG